MVARPTIHRKKKSGRGVLTRIGTLNSQRHTNTPTSATRPATIAVATPPDQSWSASTFGRVLLVSGGAGGWPMPAPCALAGGFASVGSLVGTPACGPRGVLGPGAGSTMAGIRREGDAG